jgi:hypothetical protein
MKTFFDRYGFALACAVIVLGSLPLASLIDAGRQGDIELYETIATDLFKGTLPYRDRVVEYPPYSIPIFVLPCLFKDVSNDGYLMGFMTLAFLADLLLKLSLLFLAFQHFPPRRAVLPVSIYCLAVVFIKYFYLQRYDVWPALISLVAVWLFLSRQFMLCGLAVAAGIGVKLYPILLVPVLFILAIRQRKGWHFAAGMGGGLLPIAVLSFFLPWWRFAEFHGARGLQVESLYASVLWLGKLLGITELEWVSVKAWNEVAGPAASATLPCARVLFASTVVLSTLLASWIASRCEKPSIAQLARLMLLPTLAFVAFNQVFSPQYMIWLLPLAVLVMMEDNSLPMLAIPLATMLTPVIYPTNSYALGLDFFQTIVLIIRNLILIAVWLWLIWVFTLSERQRGQRNSGRLAANRAIAQNPSDRYDEQPNTFERLI